MPFGCSPAERVSCFHLGLSARARARTPRVLATRELLQ
jgi:hypothetical protein